METIQSLKISAFQLNVNKSKFITVTFLRDSPSFFRFTSLLFVSRPFASLETIGESVSASRCSSGFFGGIKAFIFIYLTPFIERFLFFPVRTAHSESVGKELYIDILHKYDGEFLDFDPS